MVKYTTRYIRKADRVYDPKDPYRFCYEHITPEAEAEFYRLIGDGPVAFTRPKAAPALLLPEQLQQRRTKAAAGKATPRSSAQKRPEKL